VCYMLQGLWHQVDEVDKLFGGSVEGQNREKLGREDRVPIRCVG
jgi:hypothetical protein